MIDIENFIFDNVYQAVSAEMPEAECDTSYVESIAVFPHLTVEEIGNEPYRRTNTDDCAENYTRLTYEVTAYSDKEGTAKSECKRLLSIADDAMQNMKFRRTRKNKPLNTARTIWEIYARYEVIVGQPYEKDGNTVYPMYRR